jgi:nucleotide-binding universal stress UspA family protein
MELRHILAGADESGAGRDAVRCALALATKASARVTVLRAIATQPDPSRTGAMAGARSPAEDAETREVVRLQRWLSPDLQMRNEMPPVDFEIGFGIPGIEICRYAEQAAVDLIVLGRKRRTQSARLLVGDTADAVARRSRLPCFFVPSGDGDIRSLLVALDGRERGMVVLQQGCDFARGIGATIRIITVEDASADEPAHLASTVPVARTAALEARARELVRRSGLALTEFLVFRGEVVSCVLSALHEGVTEALVIGCHRGGPPGILEAGSDARRLLHTVPCAVLTIPL